MTVKNKEMHIRVSVPGRVLVCGKNREEDTVTVMRGEGGIEDVVLFDGVLPLTEEFDDASPDEIKHILEPIYVNELVRFKAQVIQDDEQREELIKEYTVMLDEEDVQQARAVAEIIEMYDDPPK